MVWRPAPSPQARPGEPPKARISDAYRFRASRELKLASRFSPQKEMTENRIKPPGQWNAYDIRCAGSTCTLAVNGVIVNTLHTSVARGYVGLEAEGYQITFKDFNLRVLK